MNDFTRHMAEALTSVHNAGPVDTTWDDATSLGLFDLLLGDSFDEAVAA